MIACIFFCWALQADEEKKIQARGGQCGGKDKGKINKEINKGEINKAALSCLN